jgi:hypothetical protein
LLLCCYYCFCCRIIVVVVVVVVVVVRLSDSPAIPRSFPVSVSKKVFLQWAVYSLGLRDVGKGEKLFTALAKLPSSRHLDLKVLTDLAQLLKDNYAKYLNFSVQLHLCFKGTTEILLYCLRDHYLFVCLFYVRLFGLVFFLSFPSSLLSFPDVASSRSPSPRPGTDASPRRSPRGDVSPRINPMSQSLPNPPSPHLLNPLSALTSSAPNRLLVPEHQHNGACAGFSSAGAHFASSSANSSGSSRNLTGTEGSNNNNSNISSNNNNTTNNNININNNKLDMENFFMVNACNYSAVSVPNKKSPENSSEEDSNTMQRIFRFSSAGSNSESKERAREASAQASKPSLRGVKVTLTTPIIDVAPSNNTSSNNSGNISLHKDSAMDASALIGTNLCSQSAKAEEANVLRVVSHANPEITMATTMCLPNNTDPSEVFVVSTEMDFSSSPTGGDLIAVNDTSSAQQGASIQQATANQATIATSITINAATTVVPIPCDASGTIASSSSSESMGVRELCESNEKDRQRRPLSQKRSSISLKAAALLKKDSAMTSSDAGTDRTSN